MKVSRALAFWGITLDELIQAIRDGDVITRRWRWGKLEVIPPHAWQKPPKSLEDLDQEVDVDRQSLIETFGDATKAPAKHGNAGRKSGGRSQGRAIIETFLRMVEKGAISLTDRGCQEAARRVHAEFSGYTEKYIAELIGPEYKELKSKRTKV